jgi:hypothetical protein
MGSQVHYEVFRRVGARGGWSLHDVRSARDDALSLAAELMAGEKATGVKVVKETYNDETGDYLSLKIFEDGHNQVKVAAAAEDAPHALPCFRPEDLYSYHARCTIARLLSDFLARCRITVTELIHRADMLEKLEATGTLYQHAIQKVAVAQAASTGTPVQQIVKNLNELATKAINRVYRDQRSGLFAEPSPEAFTALAMKLAGHPDGAYLFNGALARSLAGAEGWDDKVARLLAIMEQAPAQEAPRALILSSVDAVVAEILSGSAALADLMGPSENLGTALARLVALFLGETPDHAKSGLAALTRHFEDDSLPEARTAIAGRLIAELKSNRRLCPQSMVDELKTLRTLANKMVLGVGRYLSHDDLVAAFTLRSRKLVAQEALGQYIAEAAADEKIERILFVEENIIGAENKRQLSTYVMPILNAPSFEGHFQNPKLPLLTRLQRLAQLQTRMRRSGFVDVSRGEFAARMDRLAAAAAARGKLFESLESRATGPVESAVTLLKLAAGGMFTEGALADEARAKILFHLAQPGFLTGYMAQAAQTAGPAGREQIMAELMDLLGKAGITAETGLRNIAA